jgi:hypothetical protein
MRERSVALLRMKSRLGKSITVALSAKDNTHHRLYLDKLKANIGAEHIGFQ